MKESTRNALMMFGLYLAIALFIFATVVLIKNVEEIKTDPIVYGMEKHEFNSCVCYGPGESMTRINMNELEEELENPVS